MKVFIGLLILQGNDSKVENAMYLSPHESIASPFFCRIMSGQRFDLLYQFLPLADNTTITDGPGSSKNKTIHRSNFKKVYEKLYSKQEYIYQ